VLGPIFARELVTVPRRRGHYPARAATVGLLAILGVTLWQALIGFGADATLGDTARFGTLLFQISIFVELLLLLFFSAVSAAGAVSQEKDRRTFLLLLLTDMRDHEIVLGKLLGSLLPLAAVLLASVPVLSMLLLLGGIDPAQVIQAAVVLAASAAAAGSLGGLVALWRDRTYQALALSVLALVLWICVGPAIEAIGPSIAAGAPWPAIRSAIDPFAAMRSVLEYDPARLAGLAPPYIFGLVMLVLGIGLNGLGIVRLRVWNPSGETIMQREGPDHDPEASMSDDEVKAFRAQAHAAPGRVRAVGENPILWRETQTLAYGRRPLLVKMTFFIVLAAIVMFALQELSRPGGRSSFAAAYGLVPVTVLSLLLVAAQAVTSITSERDGGALDVLLVTDISPREFIFGKLVGAARNTWLFIVPPFALAAYYAAMGALTRSDPAADTLSVILDNLGPLIAILATLAVLVAFALALGVHVALRLINSRLAIAHTLGTVFFLCIGTLICIYFIVINGGSFANQWLSFIAFLALGIGGLMWVLNGDRPSAALSVGAVLCPLAMFYAITNVLIARPGTDASADPLVPALTLVVAFGFSVTAMLFPLITEFDVALGRTTAAYEE
jgi:ABC-type Na+ efflux pump permease subunit